MESVLGCDSMGHVGYVPPGSVTSLERTSLPNKNMKPNNSTPLNIFTEIHVHVPQETDENVPIRVIHNIPKLETTQMFIQSRTDSQILVYSCNQIHIAMNTIHNMGDFYK